MPTLAKHLARKPVRGTPARVRGTEECACPGRQRTSILNARGAGGKECQVAKWPAGDDACGAWLRRPCVVVHQADAGHGSWIVASAVIGHAGPSTLTRARGESSSGLHLLFERLQMRGDLGRSRPLVLSVQVPLRNRDDLGVRCGVRDSHSAASATLGCDFGSRENFLQTGKRVCDA